jgi:exopolysaccharide biosynthesis protein
MVVAEGRSVEYPGCGVADIAEIMLQYGCVQAMNLDGGTSSMMYYKGEYITRCSNSDLPGGRTLPTAWVYRSAS